MHIVIQAPPVSECSPYVAPSIAHHFRSVYPPCLLSVPLLELNCFIRGDDPRHIPVKITRTESVGTLKDKNPESFRGVDARSFVLWKVSIPVEDNFQENVGKVELRDVEALSPVDILSDVFSEAPGRKRLHIIVRSPPASEFKLIRHYT
jgi:hypothetical protein